MAQSDTIAYAVVEGWEQLPTGYAHRDVAGVAVDGEDRVYLICRGDHPVIVYDQQGNFLRSWGEGAFTARTHGISVGPNGTIFCTDDGNHTVRQFAPEGKPLMTLGVMNTPSDTGYDGKEGVSELWICYPLTEEETHQYGVRGAMLTQVLHCPYCHETDIVRHGKSPEGKQRYRCRQCLEGDGRTFLLEYAYAGPSPAIKQQIVDMAMNASGIRDTARVLHISPTTVIKE